MTVRVSAAYSEHTSATQYIVYIYSQACVTAIKLPIWFPIKSGRDWCLVVLAQYYNHHATWPMMVCRCCAVVYLATHSGVPTPHSLSRPNTSSEQRHRQRHAGIMRESRGQPCVFLGGLRHATPCIHWRQIPHVELNIAPRNVLP